MARRKTYLMSTIVIHETPAAATAEDRSIEREIIDAMARALFVHAWAAKQDRTFSEHPCARAPVDTDASAFREAQTLVTELLYDATLASLWRLSRRTYPNDPAEWGELTALRWAASRAHYESP